MDHLTLLENKSVYVLREAYANFRDLAMLWSIGKDSTVLLWLARKAFFGHVPFPLIHIDTGYKIPEMIRYRDRLTSEWGLTMIVGQDEDSLRTKQTYPEGKKTRLECCKALKSQTLERTLNATGPRKIFDQAKNGYVPETSGQVFSGVIAGVRADEEGSRSKERYFSPRTGTNDWEIADQPPEFWNHYKTEFAPGTHVRIHPLLDWTELNIWEYINAESIPTVDLYYDRGNGTRYRSLGCQPCTFPIESTAKNPADIIAELKSGNLKNIAERSGRAQDAEDGGLETLRKSGYM